MLKKLSMKRVLVILLVLALLAMVLLFGLNAWVLHKTKGRILSPEESTRLTGIDCILILGCGVRGDTPSPMLADRLEQGIALYQAGVAPKLLMSGDHGTTDYNEVTVMKRYAMEAGIPSEDIFMDHAGFSTYESLYRARDVFCARRIVVVSQEYHLNRALYDGLGLHLEVWGVAAREMSYRGQLYREARELVARDKDVIWLLLQMPPQYLGEAIPVSGNGDVTNDDSDA